MSKKFRDKICVYCGCENSVTGDHVFARALFLKTRRANLPKVPACAPCNRRKAELEHYIATVLPFGGRHNDALTNLSRMVPKRLAKNAILRSFLQNRMERIWTQEKQLLVPTTAIPLDWSIFEQWFVFLVKGLAWHHWKVLIEPECSADVVALTRHGEQFFKKFQTMRVAERICQDFGAGTISYQAVQGIDNPKISVWEFSIYGGVKFGGDSDVPRQEASKVGVLVGPKEL